MLFGWQFSLWEPPTAQMPELHLMFGCGSLHLFPSVAG
ncbi:hypothetical protein T4D_1685 [Trichinella pseudospiralis]|uniref:Uncharacterized protein n=1 Tax=Trichinella pseudospiralis TaxID=6337 RepID=A0A0V1DLK4_TRIPS|nr:hypothetical protein T4D_1685 [Trichinella pseudospiralis]